MTNTFQYNDLKPNKTHKIYRILTIILLLASLVCAFIFLYTPIQNIEEIKSDLSNHKHTQIQYINNNIDLVPQIISLSKGYIIKNSTALKDIIQINILTKTQNNNISDIYLNQIQILTLTNKIVNNAMKKPPLANNKKFKELYNKFNELYNTAIDGYNHCIESSKILAEYMNKPLYQKFLDPKELRDLLCIQKI